ncbi:MAG: hypothetical protein ACOCWQ_04440 [Nanoarchaeota archaeon]
MNQTAEAQEPQKEDEPVMQDVSGGLVWPIAAVVVLVGIVVVFVAMKRKKAKSMEI